ncbi:unnamed protein product [Brachionus calyciflorus]|uniref:Peroxin-14 n=1 Tax=Brachionus calyciflorus TaxID=104777 RepID=A0A813YHW0_9BILA|nr:unnamed protein product [Brachionus calyciflorus]
MIKTTNDQLNNSLNDIKHSINQLKDSIEAMNGSIMKLSVQKQSTDYDSSLKTEIQSVKNLLLSRQQFPNIPSVAPIIPTWQLESKSSPTKDKESLNESTDSKSDLGSD